MQAPSPKNPNPKVAVLESPTGSAPSVTGLLSASRRSRSTRAEHAPAVTVCGAPSRTSFVAPPATTDAPWGASVSPADEARRVIASAWVPRK